MATIRIHNKLRRHRDCCPFFNFSFFSLFISIVILLVRDLTMSYVQWITLFLFPLYTTYQHQINLLKSFLPILFSSSKSSLTPHSQQIRYTLRSLAFKAICNCTHITFPCLCTLIHAHPHCNALLPSPNILIDSS